MCDELTETWSDTLGSVEGIISCLQAIAQDGDCNIDRDDIADACDAAAKRLKSMQESLVQEVDRLERLQPFFDEVRAAVVRAENA